MGPSIDDGARGTRLRALRLALNLTQQDLATRAAIDRIIVVKAEGGRNQLTGVASLAALATATETSIENLDAYLDGKLSLRKLLATRPVPDSSKGAA